MSLATSNAFAALADPKKAKKKSSKEHDKKSKKKEKKVSTAELEKAIFSQPSINITSWADEDDDDYAVPALPSNWEQVRSGAHTGFSTPAGRSCSHL
jgi:triosephosphate isomerase